MLPSAATAMPLASSSPSPRMRENHSWLPALSYLAARVVFQHRDVAQAAGVDLSGEAALDVAGRVHIAGRVGRHPGGHIELAAGAGRREPVRPHQGAARAILRHVRPRAQPRRVSRKIAGVGRAGNEHVALPVSGHREGGIARQPRSAILDDATPAGEHGQGDFIAGHRIRVRVRDDDAEAGAIVGHRRRRRRVARCRRARNVDAVAAPLIGRVGVGDGDREGGLTAQRHAGGQRLPRDGRRRQAKHGQPRGRAGRGGPLRVADDDAEQRAVIAVDSRRAVTGAGGTLDRRAVAQPLERERRAAAGRNQEGRGSAGVDGGVGRLHGDRRRHQRAASNLDGGGRRTRRRRGGAAKHCKQEHGRGAAEPALEGRGHGGLLEQVDPARPAHSCDLDHPILLGTEPDRPAAVYGSFLEE